MCIFTGGVSHLAQAIELDLKVRDTDLQKPHIAALSDLAASILTCRSVNSSEWLSILPRQTRDPKSKERYISRTLSKRQFDISERNHIELIDFFGRNHKLFLKF